ncbi:endolytic transglycosylase MltG [Crassaminicella indica]|uniref:Endolytic transglycosylase MltG n=1 Tax=Crassaminicella indica TaxID=2855394 RepID=A0ABX8RAN2_9CLOT|nr:endolytic transglycosylase MltG [Crassaminicella indica]QXM06119.1 endolytic transglycosylase MltG [Crassaminicella indica]
MRRDVLVGVFLGIGIGLILSSGFNMILHQNKRIIDEEFIKSEAKKIGMIDPVEYFDKRDMNIKIDTKEDKDKKIIIEIQKGYKSEDVARILKENNLIRSEEEFLNKINNKNLENKLRWGKYEFTSKDSEDQIIEKIIKGKNVKE